MTMQFPVSTPEIREPQPPGPTPEPPQPPAPPSPIPQPPPQPDPPPVPTAELLRRRALVVAERVSRVAAERRW